MSKLYKRYVELKNTNEDQIISIQIWHVFYFFGW